jgi:hypothetical protein
MMIQIERKLVHGQRLYPKPHRMSIALEPLELLVFLRLLLLLHLLLYRHRQRPGLSTVEARRALT